MTTFREEWREARFLVRCMSVWAIISVVATVAAFVYNFSYHMRHDDLTSMQVFKATFWWMVIPVASLFLSLFCLSKASARELRQDREERDCNV